MIFVIFKAEAFVLFATFHISRCITLLAVGRIQGVTTAYSNCYFLVMAVGQGQRAAFPLE